jgi:hypothetical protein
MQAATIAMNSRPLVSACPRLVTTRVTAIRHTLSRCALGPKPRREHAGVKVLVTGKVLSLRIERGENLVGAFLRQFPDGWLRDHVEVATSDPLEGSSPDQ